MLDLRRHFFYTAKIVFRRVSEFPIPFRSGHSPMKKSFLSVLSLVGSVLLAANSPTQASIPLTPERSGHSDTLLPSGKVLIAGGVNETSVLDSALLYDPATGAFATTGRMTTPRSNHTATLLTNGRVLITGGDLNGGRVARTAEIYDPATGTFAKIAPQMSTARSKHTASLLPNGNVLIVGGPSADIYDPNAVTFTVTPNNTGDRSSHAAVSLADGTVLITGGYIRKNAMSDAWLYNPSTGNFTLLASPMKVARANHQTTLLLDGRVLVSGGFTGTSPQDEADLYDPIQQVFTSTSHLLYHRSNHRTVLLPGGRVLAVGGTTLESGFLAENEVWDPATSQWSLHDVMSENRSGESATVLATGQVLIAGGLSGNKTLQTAEVIDPATHIFTSLGNMQVARNQHTATLLADGKVLLAAGSTDAVYLNSAEIFDPSNNSFSLAGTLAVARKSHTETLLPSGQVLITGGKTESADSRSAELFNPGTRQFSSTGSMVDVRSLHTATLLNNGTVLIAAGRKGATPLNTAEIYNPQTGLFTSTGSLEIQRKRHRANLLTNGTVMVEGGASLSNGDPVDEGTPTAEVYNPRSGLWTRVQDMHIGRTEHDATLLLDGNVLVTGGLSGFDTSDLYNSPRRTFSEVAGVIEPRQRHTAVLLSNPAWGSLVGKVLIIGGAATGNSAFGGISRALDSVEMYDPVTRQITSFGTMTATRQNHTATMLQDGRILVAGGVDSPVFSGTAELVEP